MTLTEQGLAMAKEINLEISIANTILSPGKFEGEHVTTLVFYDAYLNGIYDEDEDGILYWSLTPEEQEHLGNGTPIFRLKIDDNGFVYGNI